MSFGTTLREHQRIAILRALTEAPGYMANLSVLVDALAPFGLMVTRDGLAVEASWLHEQGLVQLGLVAAVPTLALTDRGLDVAQGRAIVPGVKRPSPGSAAMSVASMLAKGP
ncbi:MAG: ArsR family transcriptional regulator [Magnetospirillum sp. WYHS-4]